MSRSGTAVVEVDDSMLRPSEWLRRWQFVLGSAAVILLVLAIYFPAHTYPFLINIDDDFYVFNNPHVLHGLQLNEIRWAFTHSYARNYDPIDFLAHSIDVRVFGMNAGWHHIVNVVLHALNAVLLFGVLRRCTGFTARSLMVAALFAVHPMNVENVAWIAELKTILSTLFFLLGIAAYIDYARNPRLWRMLVVSFWYGIGLLCKPQIITFPFVLLLLDYWPLGRLLAQEPWAHSDTLGTAKFPATTFVTLLREKWLLFVITAVDIPLTIHAENKDGIERYTFLIRLGSAIRSYVVYIGKAFWPSNLGFNYPHPGYSLRWMEVGLALFLLLGISALIWANKEPRYLTVGWLWFLGTMVPTINLVQIDVSALADRYAYIPYIGLFVMICWGAAELARRWKLPRFALPTVGGAVLIALAVAAHHQVGYWSDAVTVWERSAEVAPHNDRSEIAAGMMLLERGDLDEGFKHIYRVLEDKPKDPDTILWAASLEQQHGHLRKAIALYREGLPLSKTLKENLGALSNMGHAYDELGDHAQAQQCYEAAQRLRQEYSGGVR